MVFWLILKETLLTKLAFSIVKSPFRLPPFDPDLPWQENIKDQSFGFGPIVLPELLVPALGPSCLPEWGVSYPHISLSLGLHLSDKETFSGKEIWATSIEVLFYIVKV